MGAWLLVLCVTGLAAGEETYQWPLDLPRVLTSSFAEYRPGRFHMGIDLRTGSAGKDVFATADGEVVRLLCSPHGYGKAVYLRLDDGHTVIFAHLDDFAPELRRHVQREQHRRKSYSIDLYPGEGAFPISKGQLIGKSGQTGIGVPHLHWEIRDPQGVPVNPRLLDIQWPDTTAPQIRKIIVEPASPESRIEGDVFPVVWDVPADGTIRGATDPLHISGPVVFGLDVVDPANGGGTKLGVHTIETMSNSGTIFTTKHDRISYDNDDDSIIAYNPAYLTDGRFLMQWRHPSNRAEIYAHAGGDGVYILAGDADTVTFSVQDFHGNGASAKLAVATASGNTPTAPETAGAGMGNVYYDNVRDWLVVSVVFDAPEPMTPVLRVNGAGLEEAFFRISDTVFRAVYVPGDDARNVELTVDHPRAGKVSPESDHLLAHRFLVIQRGASGKMGTLAGVHVIASEHSAYGTLLLTAGEALAQEAPGLKALGPAYQFWPDYGPVRAPLTLAFPVPEGVADMTGLSIYRKGKKRWEWLETDVNEGRLEIQTSELGTFQVMRDTEAPRLAMRTVQEGGVLQPLSVISADIDDAGSGIESWSAHFNGEWLLMEYDPEQDRIEWEQDQPLPSGPGELTVRAADRAGRVTETRLQVTVESPPN